MKQLLSLEKLVETFKSFPSIGSKTAERMAFSILDMPKDKAYDIANTIIECKNKIHQCPVCGLLTENNICEICSDSKREHSLCIVIAQSKDVYNFEKIESYKGTYHVLGGLISSLHGVTPNDLKINELIERVKKENIKEIIIATNATIEGETTALYLSKILADLNIKVTRLGYGLPVGGQLEYVDDSTISKALDNRKELK